MEDNKYQITSQELANLLNSPAQCVLRHDLDPRTDNPATSGGYLKIDWTKPRRSFQPDRLDDCEFNMFVIAVEKTENTSCMIVCVNSIDFDWMLDESVIN